ncbi:hypothetical protein Cal6303_0746 [Calothrix sp. PCC 6303]|nr:hypothetical protein Cal6303_0746 [Calothrix sp. PCC 6303]
MKPALAIIVEIPWQKNFFHSLHFSKLLAGITRYGFEMEQTTLVGFSDRYYY